MNEQIRRLKKNLAQFGELRIEDRGFFVDAEDKDVLVLKPDGKWAADDDAQQDLADKSGKKVIYRLVADYQPEPDKPVFPGYELCEVKDESDSGIMERGYYGKDRVWKPLSQAVDSGFCCGYVFKEKPTVICESPCTWTQDDELYGGRTITDNRVPATLGWVAFPEKAGAE